MNAIPRGRSRPKPGFTIVELLVVIAILALLMAMLVPALRGVQQRNRKLTEANSIRQIGQAWNMYANYNRDATLPGYIEEDVQKAWRVRYEYPVPPDPSKPGDLRISAEIAAPWTWRLLPYVDHNIESVWRYRDAPSMNLSALIAMEDDPSQVQTLMKSIAEEPGFAYNAYHVGGWWEMTFIQGSDVPQPKFASATSIFSGTPSSVNVVSRSIPSIRRPAEVIVFCTAAKYTSVGVQRRLEDDHPGWHFATPGTLADVPQWTSPAPASAPRPGVIETFVSPAHAPLGRYNRFVTVLNADGSIETALPEAIHGQNRWIDYASEPDFTFDP